jgi:hypothetical protein
VALSDDQKAMLRLLAQREQGYEDLASLMGLSVEEVRAQVKDALAELDADGPPQIPTPKAPERPSAPPAPEPKPQSTAKSRKPNVRPKLKMPADPRLRLGAAAAGATALVLIVLLIAGVFGGSDDSGSNSASQTSNSKATAAADNSNLKGITRAVLSPVSGGDATGRALFGRVRKNVVLEVVAKGLEPSSAGESYSIWLYKSPQVALRVGAVRVGKPGVMDAQLPIPLQLLQYVSSGGFDQISVALTSDAAYKDEVAAARKGQRLPSYTGEEILRGKIVGPLANAGANRG